MRYQAASERAFYKDLTELQKLRKEGTKPDIGFERKKALETAQARAAERHRYSTRALERKDALQEYDFNAEIKRRKEGELLFKSWEELCASEKAKAKPRS